MVVSPNTGGGLLTIINVYSDMVHGAIECGVYVCKMHMQEQALLFNEVPLRLKLKR
jgi:hypothetical protein